MSISAKQVGELRKKTGAGLMDCKKALAETNGDMEKATEYLQKKSLAAVGKRANKVAAEGIIDTYVHSGRIGVLLEVNCETDFVARGEQFQEMARNISMHVAAMSPSYLDPSEIPADEAAKQKDIYRAQLLEEGKPEHILDRILIGKMNKWHSEICLLNQSYVKDDKKSVHDYVTEVASVIKEKISVRRFVRFELGAGIEKKVDDFAAEVAAAAAGN
jgi:elongation factor Ts